MDKRIKVGIPFSNDKNWIAGVYYRLNLIKALDTLPENTKPSIYILSSNKNDYFYVKEVTAYPYLYFIKIPGPIPLFFRILNKITYFLFKKKWFDKSLRSDSLDCVITLSTSSYDNWLRNIKNKFYWIPDFQEHFLPSFFSPSEIMNRKIFQTKLAYSQTNIVLSSNAAFQDFQKIYPGYVAKVHILPFAVFIPTYDTIDFNVVRAKFQLPSEYFFCPNQFWRHKNHLVVLKALELAVKMNRPFYVVFTGYKRDYRNIDYFDKIIEFIHEKQLEKYVFILGFIERLEQLLILKNARALIQPSLFEGWSTTIEEAKALNKVVIASHISVHKEQLGQHGIFFDPDQPEDLLRAIDGIVNKNVVNYQYDKEIELFGKRVWNVFVKKHSKSVLVE